MLIKTVQMPKHVQISDFFPDIVFKCFICKSWFVLHSSMYVGT